MDNANFRFYHNNKGCLACLEEDRYSKVVSTGNLFGSVVTESKCEECYIYKMGKEYKNTIERHADDGK